MAIYQGINVFIPAHPNNFQVGRSGNSIKRIALHHTAGVMTPETVGAIFQNPSRIASSHYGAGIDGRIAGYVHEENTAFTNGNQLANRESVTIEISNSATGGVWPVSDLTLRATIILVADIARRNNIKLVKGETLVYHRMYQATTCPGDYLLSKFDYIIQEVNKINGQPQPKPGYQPRLTGILRKGSKGYDVRILQQALIITGHILAPPGVEGADGIFGAITERAVRMTQQKNGIAVDGIAGPDTFRVLGI